MEIRDVRLLSDDKIICTFTVYIPDLHLSLLTCLKRGKKGASEFITPFSKAFEEPDGLRWQPHWAFDEKQQKRLLEALRPMLKEAMNKGNLESASYGTQERIPL